jgi:hypothetical protein
MTENDATRFAALFDGEADMQMQKFCISPGQRSP